MKVEEEFSGSKWYIPMVPMNWTLMPVCSSLLPSLGRIVTAPFTDSPSIYKGAFSLLFLSSFMSIIVLSSVSSRTMSMSTGVEKKYDILATSILEGNDLAKAAEHQLGGCVLSRIAMV